MEEVKVSYCVPAYNVEKYLADCIKSIQSEGLESYEIIIVDDQSNDETLTIANELAASDSRVTVVPHQFNQGLPSARNSALKVAKGEFIRHVDGDDKIAKGSTTMLLEAIESESADVSRGSSDIFSDETGNVEPMPWANRGIGNFVVENFYDSTFFKVNAIGYVWLYLYRASFLRDIGDPQFIENVSILEDDMYNSRVLPKAQKIAVIDSTVTFYRFGGMSSGRLWSFKEYIEQATGLGIVSQHFQGKTSFLSVYLNRKSIFVIEKLKLFRKAGYDFEQFSLYFELLHKLYKNENLEPYVGDGIEENGDYQTCWEGNLKLLHLIHQGDARKLYSDLQH